MGVVGNASTIGAAVKMTRGRHPLSKRIGAVLPMLRDAFTGRWVDAPRFKLLAGLIGIGYVLSPLDVLPEVLMGPFGLGDDLAIAVVSVAALLGSAESWLDMRDLKAAGFPPAGGYADASPSQPDVVMGEIVRG